VGGGIGRVDGAILVAGSIGYTSWQVATARGQYMRASSLPDFEEKASREPGVARNVAYILVGSLALWLGSEGVIRGAVGISEALHLDMRFVALTVVALGTSLPEFSASTVASVRGEEGISLGNVIGSNIMNILFVLGFTALVHPVPVAFDANMWVDMGVMLFIALLLWPVLRIRHVVTRAGGLLLLAIYLGYVAYRAFVVFSA
jgi:cation:H+ antiporter